jgi:hypothetical protein
MKSLSRVLRDVHDREGAIKIIDHCKVPHRRFGKKGYRVDEDAFWLTCRGFQYEIGEKYTHYGDIVMCSSGHHYCIDAKDCYEYYDYASRIFKVEAIGSIIIGDDKIVTNEIKIVSELGVYELRSLANKGRKNLGALNEGDSNVGISNNGESNRGDRNKGRHNNGVNNNGAYNDGRNNQGDYNSGIFNTGDSNNGNENNGDCNNGFKNRGDSNFGKHNTGIENIGAKNIGTLNRGESNHGFCNIGINWHGCFNIGYCEDVSVLWFFNTKTDIPFSHENIKKYIEMAKKDPKKLPHFDQDIYDKFSEIFKDSLHFTGD